ncbi:hypothetical protein [Candidatus Poriferisodalis sp.]|uniref:hypothetical protein n=1 Tax=Candidatus Poriferisodalis sp. TaxID=3101277 RepID=UPI003B02630B
MGAEPEDEHLSRLITSDVLRAGHGDAADVLDEPPLQIPTSLTEAAEREGLAVVSG